MSEVQYGVRTPHGTIHWPSRRDVAEDEANQPGWVLMAREVGEPHEVKDLPTAGGSVVKVGTLFYVLANENGPWVSRHYIKTPEELEKYEWTLVFDAGAADD
jgi:hypothetical protein